MNEQIAQALAQLRDVHEPALPAFWPLPVGWWVLAALILIALGCLVWSLYRRRITDRPYRTLRNVVLQIQRRFQANEISQKEYVAAVNRLYKHLLVDIEPTPGSRQAHGTIWLTMLANRFNEDGFVSGDGSALGTVRYAPIPYFDERIVALVDRTLAVVTADPKASRTA